MTEESRAPQLLAGFLSDRLTADRPLWVYLRTIPPEDWYAVYELAVVELQKGQQDDEDLRALQARLLALEHLRRRLPS
jgi:hypothetical protein